MIARPSSQLTKIEFLLLTFSTTYRKINKLQYRSIFNVPKAKLEALESTMLTEMDLGLAGKQGGLMMLPSFVDILPTG
jgi:hypothetical protein